MIPQTVEHVLFLLLLLLGGGPPGLCKQQAFRTHPVNVSVVLGTEALFECTIENLSGQVQWARNGLAMGPDRSLPGFPRQNMVGRVDHGEYNLQIKQTELGDEAWYQCQVSPSQTSQGIVSQSIWLNVLVPPQSLVIVEYPGVDEVTWVAGKEYQLTCTAMDAKPTPKVTWYKNDMELPTEDVTDLEGSQPKLSSRVVVTKYTPTATDNKAKVRCEAQNPALTQARQVEFTLIVFFPPAFPVIDGQTDMLTVKAGDIARFPCSSKGGNPLASVKWFKGNEVIFGTWETEEKGSVPFSRSVLEFSVSPTDNGVTLRCEAGNHVTPEPMKVSITLRVIFPPITVNLLGRPGGKSVVEGDQLLLSCITSSSNPAARLRWWASGREIPSNITTYTYADNGGQTATSNLTYISSRELDGKTIECEAVNEELFITKSATSIIQVFYPPERLWIEGPEPGTTVLAGTAVRLVCYAIGGNPSATLTWAKGESTKTGIYSSTGKLASLEILVVAASNDNKANYTCSANNKASIRTLRQSTQLSVHFPPREVWIEHNGTTIRAGHPATFHCHTDSSNPACSLEWFKDGYWLKGVGGGVHQAEYGGWTTLGHIVLTPSSRDHGRRLTCQASHQLLPSTVNNLFKLDVLFRPEFQPEQKYVVETREGTTTILHLFVQANPTYVTYIWMKNGEAVITDDAERFKLHDGGALMVVNVTSSDAGDYYVMLSNEEGQQEGIIKLIVNYSPKIQQIPREVFVDRGATAVLVCSADAYPVRDDMVHWEVEEFELPPNQVYHQGTSTLTLPKVDRSLSGTYICNADNGIAPPAKAIVHLFVRFKPQIHQFNDFNKVAAPGDGSSGVLMLCQAEGLPVVFFSWARNGIAVEPNEARYSFQTVHGVDKHETQLIITNVSAQLDFGTFTCTARNALGEDKLHIQLVKTSSPEPPTRLQLVTHTHNSVTLTWIAGYDGGFEQKFRVHYKQAEAENFMYVDVYPSHSTIFTITGLHPNTVYNFTVNAMNSLGESEYADGGFQVSVTTSERPPDDQGSGTTPTTPFGEFTLPIYALILLVFVGSFFFLLHFLSITPLIRRCCVQTFVSSLQFLRRIWPFTVESSSSQMRDLAGTSDTQSDHSYESCEPATSTTTDIYSNLHYMVTTQEELSESNFDTGSSQSWPNGQQYESTESSGYFDMGERWPPLDGVWQTTNQHGGRVWDMLPMEDILEEGSSDVSNDNQPLPSHMAAKSNQPHGLLV